eukprot:Gregarina_sp_Poly_1__4992@NODE_2646_length_1875_cov_356_521018_g1679_i0_p2_GENE_NODE_2646_length_1875_cov_356_521018_g1679_i0NODE_2646_length_1875_cov_356_521018_g1679_i0_p2_ORF_typecomplete_len233_score6_34_NODE_2646_length_1875_cov_356_521018_g1679_i09691667
MLSRPTILIYACIVLRVIGSVTRRLKGWAIQRPDSPACNVAACTVLQTEGQALLCQSLTPPTCAYRSVIEISGLVDPADVCVEPLSENWVITFPAPFQPLPSSWILDPTPWPQTGVVNLELSPPTSWLVATVTPDSSRGCGWSPNLASVFVPPHKPGHSEFSIRCLYRHGATHLALLLPSLPLQPSLNVMYEKLQRNVTILGTNWALLPNSVATQLPLYWSTVPLIYALCMT